MLPARQRSINANLIENSKKLENQKKAWVTPELIVLVRSKPEEAVLLTCKITGNAVGPALKLCAKTSGSCALVSPS